MDGMDLVPEDTIPVACRLEKSDYHKLVGKKPQGLLMGEFIRKILKEYINK